MVAAEGTEADEGTEAEGMETDLNRVTGSIIGAAIEVHRELGPGLLESAYQACLERELVGRGHRLDRQCGIPLVYKRKVVRQQFRLDLIVDRWVLVEIKAVKCLLPVHEAQVLSYLRLARLPLGLLINFHGPTLISGLRRFRVSVPSSPSVTSTPQRKGE
jgi:GxxExxY protein